MTNTERIQANNAELRECIEMAEGLPNAGGGSGANRETEILDRTISGEYVNDAVTIFGYAALAQCKELTSIICPALKETGQNSIYSCSKLTTVYFPSLETIGPFTFTGCTKLTSVDSAFLTSIGSSAFSGCHALASIIIRNESAVCSLASTLTNCSIAKGTGYIYVPSALVEEYKAATNWSTYPDQFRALEDYTVDGTVTGELDPTKI